MTAGTARDGSAPTTPGGLPATAPSASSTSASSASPPGASSASPPGASSASQPDPPPRPSAAATHARLSAIGWATAGAGTAVVSLAIGFLIPLFGSLHQLGRLALINGPLILAYLGVTGLLITRYTAGHVYDTLRWFHEDRPPTEREHARTLRLAAYAVKLDVVAWLIAGVLFGVLNGVLFSWGIGALVVGTIWLGGETACALDYLLQERALRPVTALALAARPQRACVGPGVRARLAIAWTLGTGVPLLGLLVVGVAGIARPAVHTRDVAEAVLFLAVVGWALGLLATRLSARAIADPLVALRRGLDRVERGELDTQVAVDDGSEVGLLQAGFNHMAEGLRERERIRDLFGRQVGADVAHAALEQGVRLGGEEREIAAMFIDLTGFTGLAATQPPAEVVRLLNRFFRVVIDVVEREGGIVNKFAGDAALCVFGAPVARENPTADALRTARAVAARMSDELPEVDFGIGVSAGMAVAGNVGAEQRFEYTVIGDPVNQAARLAELAKQRPGRVLASDTALDRVPSAESDAWRITDTAVLRGRSVPTGLGQPEPHAG